MFTFLFRPLGFDLDLKKSIELVMLEYKEKEVKLLINSAGSNLLRNELFFFLTRERTLKSFITNV